MVEPAVSCGEVTHLEEVPLPSVASQDMENSNFSGLFSGLAVFFFVIWDLNMWSCMHVWYVFYCGLGFSDFFFYSYVALNSDIFWTWYNFIDCNRHCRLSIWFLGKLISGYKLLNIFFSKVCFFYHVLHAFVKPFENLIIQQSYFSSQPASQSIVRSAWMNMWIVADIRLPQTLFNSLHVALKKNKKSLKQDSMSGNLIALN